MGNGFSPAGKAQGPRTGRGEIGVCCEDKDAAPEIQLPLPCLICPVSGAASLVQDGHEHFENLRVGFFQLIEHKHCPGIPTHCLQDGLVLIAHVARRRAGQTVDGVRLGEGVQLRPDGLVPLPPAALQGRGQGLAQLRLTHPCRAVKHQGQGPGGLTFCKMAVQPKGGSFHSSVLAQHPLAQVMGQAHTRLRPVLPRCGCRGGTAQLPSQRGEPFRQGFVALETPEIPAKEGGQNPAGPVIVHGGPPVKQIAAVPLTGKAQQGPLRDAAIRHEAVRKFIAALLPGAQVNALPQGAVARLGGGAELRKCSGHKDLLSPGKPAYVSIPEKRKRQTRQAAEQKNLQNDLVFCKNSR